MPLKARLIKIRQVLEEKKTDCIIIARTSNIFYLTGLYGIEGYLCILKKNIVFFTGGIYYQFVYDRLKDVKLANFSLEDFNKGNFIKFVKNLKKPSVLASEFSVQRWKALCQKTGKQIKPVNDFIYEMRAIKTLEEIEKIKSAEKITFSVLKKIRSMIKPGVSELDISSEIHYQIRKQGGDKESFQPIVASGVNSSYPHHQPTRRKLKENDIVVIDIGACVVGYNSDITETIILGKMSEDLRVAFNAVKLVHTSVCELISSGEKSCKKLHNYALNIFKRFNLDTFFVHGLGHGVGIDIHELPVLAKSSRDILKKGMVFTIEPGVYLPEKFGIRIEKMVYV